MVRELFLNNLSWKVLSLALAVAIWLTVKGFSSDSGTESERTFFDLPTQVISSTTDVRACKTFPGQVQVTVKGRPETIRALTDKDLRVFVDGTTSDPTRNFRQRVEASTPTRVTVAKIEPAEVEVVQPPRPPKTDPRSKP